MNTIIVQGLLNSALAALGTALTFLNVIPGASGAIQPIKNAITSITNALQNLPVTPVS